MIYSFLIFTLVMAIDLITDVRLYMMERQPDKVRGAVLRCIGLTPCVWLMGWWSIPMIFLGYLILFNGFYNLLIGQSWEYLGTTSKIDIFLSKYPTWIKYVFLIISIIFYAKF